MSNREENTTAKKTNPIEDMPEDKLERWVEFMPAFDKRSDDPKKNYGIGDVRVFFYLRGKKGAVQFAFGTGIFLPDTHTKWLSRFPFNAKRVPYMAHDIGYHSPVPMYEDQTGRPDCELLKGECFYDGSALNAEKYMSALVEKGSSEVWKLMLEYYFNRFYQKIVSFDELGMEEKFKWIFGERETSNDG